ncbi:amylo-alpha-1,6-glucosidase [Melioribacteraceae bacterium 4301-Me]|uniref:amylo-alpha-1,6-glucosidase n=1 Tax=Pyranulibacter aquaticus TaxID=3163344 RepID=UPI0035988520
MKLTTIIILILTVNLSSQTLHVNDKFLMINAAADDPLFTTYTAAMQRSRLYGDKGYKMDYYSDCYPINYSGDQAGKFYCIWKVNQVVVMNIEDYHKKPVVTASFPDMAILEYEPFKGIHVQETFFVYSSSIAMVSMQIKNYDNVPHEIEIYPILELGNDSLLIKYFDNKNFGYVTNHYESKYRLISSLYKNAPYPTQTRDFFCGNFKPYSYGGYSESINEFYIKIKTDYYSNNRSDTLNLKNDGYVNFIALHNKFTLKSGEQKNIRYFRGWQDQKENLDSLIGQINKLKTEPLQKYVDENVELFSKVPRINFKTEDEKLVYIGAFNLVRGCMLPPTDSAKHNFYVFSRQPLWGWGHGHQVLHESLSMLAYAYMDPLSAEGSQRIYIDQQRKDGLIAYRHGPRGLQDYPHYSKELGKEMSTTSAPFFSWINWEVYKVSKDKKFLEDAYKSGSKYVNWLEENRDTDHDGLFEWGPYGIIENVRDWYNVVFQVSKERHLDVDKEDISDELEDLDLSLMVVNEMKSLAKMAEALGYQKEKEKWMEKANHISNLINKFMWDDSTGFYYHVDKKNHYFKYLTRDLKHKEIIGFLALWSGTATKGRAEKLVQHLTNPNEFWRKYGIPTLSADDPFYSPYVDYCCKWNGPVWLLWDYMVIDGLKKYGYKKIADEISEKMLLAVITQLKKNHNFWESYSADNDVLNSPSNYIWDSIIARVLIDKYNKEAK